MELQEHLQPKSTSSLNVLIELDAAGGHSEAFSETHGLALTALMEARLVRRVTYPAGLVIYEITDAGRRLSQAWLPANKEPQ